MAVISYGNQFLAAEGEGTELNPAIVVVGLRLKRAGTYGQVGSNFPMPTYRSPLTVFPFASGAGSREILPSPGSGQRYVLNSLFLSSSSGAGMIMIEEDDENVYPELGTYPVSPRIMGSPILLTVELLPGSAVIASPLNTGIVYGGFFLGRIV